MELKIKEISKELNAVLNRLKKEKNIVKTVLKDDTKNNTNKKIFETKKFYKPSKAYVTILREVNYK